MQVFLGLVPAFPLAGFLVLALFGKRFPRGLTAAIGTGSVGLAAGATFYLAACFLSSPPDSGSLSAPLWTWFEAGDLKVDVTLYLDALSLVMIFVVTFVGFLIHLYSTEYMADDEGYSRFFAYMNLFIASMLILVLGDSLLLLYLGWEGVGLCSYLLIGFWYKDPENGRAARKAFIVTRVGDSAMAVGLFLLFWEFKNLNIQDVMDAAVLYPMDNSGLALAVALLLLGGAVGKSAQLPLQTWLPDAMAGPTPVSALIHAATMVTAGVYLIARTHVIFTLAPAAMTVVAVVGAATLLIAGFSALVQTDIKRVLAYSTISQIGYMFLGLGVGAWSAAVFHLMIHAFFKALLFLGAGAIIICLHHEQNIFKMGGLRRRLPAVFWTFLIGSASLAALPLVTAGFFSKDLILWCAWCTEYGSPWLWGAGAIGAFLTALYSFRLVFIVFFGEEKGKVEKRPGLRILFPLVMLAFLSIVGGFVETPEFLGHATFFSDLMKPPVLPATASTVEGHETELILQGIVAVVTLIGIYLAYLVFLKRPGISLGMRMTPQGRMLNLFWFSGFGFDAVYDRVLVRPFVGLARVLREDFFDYIYAAISMVIAAFHFLFSRTECGRLRMYAFGIGIGAVIAVAIVVLS